MKCTISVMCLNYPQTIPPPWPPALYVEKLSFIKLVPDAKKVGDL